MKKNSRFYILSLGCPKNLVDGENIVRSLSAGLIQTDNPKNAEVILINTCSFLKSATEESIDAILEAAKFKTTGLCKKLIVCGCLAGRYSQKELKKSMPEVDLFVKPYEIKNVLNYLNIPHYCNSEKIIHPELTPKHRAYVKIADGCNNKCSYCLIPKIRGGLKSRPIKDIKAEVKTLFESEVKEITLVAQDTTAYGRDLNKKTNIINLLENLKEFASDKKWIRLLYSQPNNLLFALADFLKNNAGFAPYIDVPIQHVSKKILKMMNRPENTKKIIRNLKNNKIFLRTTVMVGFPGETEKDFDELVDFVKEIEFDHLGVFVFSPEEGSKAYKLKSKIPSKIASERFNYIMELQADISAKKLRNFIGKEAKILVEGRDLENRIFGRHMGQSPEIDGVVFLKNIKQKDFGKIINTKFSKTENNYDLIANKIN